MPKETKQQRIEYLESKIEVMDRQYNALNNAHKEAFDHIAELREKILKCNREVQAKEIIIENIKNERRRMLLKFICRLEAVKLLHQVLRTPTSHKQKNIFLDHTDVVLTGEINNLKTDYETPYTELPF